MEDERSLISGLVFACKPELTSAIYAEALVNVLGYNSVSFGGGVNFLPMGNGVLLNISGIIDFGLSDFEMKSFGIKSGISFLF